MKNYPYRFLARVIIQAQTPLAVGNGEKSILTDSTVATDVNGLPYIPGTSIAGVIRSMIGEEKAKVFFGYSGNKKSDGHGSTIIFTEAKILDSTGKVIDGLQPEAPNSDIVLKEMLMLPIRQHVRINENGTAVKHGKFDEQIVLSGTRFCFEIEMLANAKNETEQFQNVLRQISSQTFRIGGGTRSGFGEINVVEVKTAELDLNNPKDLELYIVKSSNLQESADWKGWNIADKERISSGWTHYELKLTANDFFLFGSGFGDEDVDITPVKEKRIDWNNGKASITNDLILIPGTSVKGAIAHRTAFYYNKLKQRFAGDNTTAKVGNDNEAVQALFGTEGDNETSAVCGNVMISDILLLNPHKTKEKIFNHVAIDRFTSGAIDGALFNEKATFAQGIDFTINIFVDEQAINNTDNDSIIKAFENALRDVCKGLLPLGGGVTKGYGTFNGEIKKNNEQLNLEEQK